MAQGGCLGGRKQTRCTRGEVARWGPRGAPVEKGPVPSAWFKALCCFLEILKGPCTFILRRALPTTEPVLKKVGGHRHHDRVSLKEEL